MKKFVAAALLSVGLCCTGCQAMEAKLGEIEKRALVNAVESDIDAKLAPYGLSIAALGSTIAADNDGKLTPEAIAIFAKDTAKEVTLVEAKKLVDRHVSDAESRLSSKHETLLGGLRDEFKKWLYGLVGAYLAHQLVLLRRARSKASAATKDDIVEAVTGEKPAPEPPAT